MGWLLVGVMMAGSGLGEFVLAPLREVGGKPLDDRSGKVRAESSRAMRVVMGIARIDLAVGGAWLVASRLGMRPMGIQEPIGLLTAVHFHFAGFATATIAAATYRFTEERREHAWLKYLVPVVAGMPFLVAAGFVISPLIKMAAAVFFSISVAGLAVAVRACGRKMEEPTARFFLQVAAGAIFAGMVLSGVYAVADWAGSDVLTIPQMARTHGLLNAMGFCLLGLLGWLVGVSSHTEVTGGRSFRAEVEREPVH